MDKIGKQIQNASVHLEYFNLDGDMAKINLLQAKGNSFFCDGIFSIGVYIKDRAAVLIDSGISKDLAKEVNKTLMERGLKVTAIINTHCHGDHSGGNAFFQQKYPDIKIFSTETERPFIEDPLMAPICFCGGAAAFEELKKCKPITPQQSSKVTDVITPYQDQKITIDNQVFEIITLPGHTRGMIAVKSADNVLYCGDAVFGSDTFKKYPVLFYTFIDETLHSFKKLKSLIAQVEVAVIYHGGVIADLASLIEDHTNRFLGIGVALAAMPIIVGLALAGFLSLNSLSFLFALMVGSKAINYALNGPALKQLYIPTTPDVKFKAQAWIETFGSRLSKQGGSLFNMSLAPLQATFGALAGRSHYLMLSGLICFPLLALWLFVALFLGNSFRKAVKEKTVIC